MLKPPKAPNNPNGNFIIIKKNKALVVHLVKLGTRLWLMRNKALWGGSCERGRHTVWRHTGWRGGGTRVSTWAGIWV